MFRSLGIEESLKDEWEWISLIMGDTGTIPEGRRNCSNGVGIVKEVWRRGEKCCDIGCCGVSFDKSCVDGV